MKDEKGVEDKFLPFSSFILPPSSFLYPPHHSACSSCTMATASRSAVSWLA